jgi:hypothetical protein
MKNPYIGPRIARAILLLVMAFSGVIANAATVRGRVLHVYPNGEWGAVPGVRVTVSNPAIGRSYPTLSGQDGMFYLQGIPPGVYNLEIWISPDPRVAPMVYTIQVQEPYSDIPPVYV